MERTRCLNAAGSDDEGDGCVARLATEGHMEISGPGIGVCPVCDKGTNREFSGKLS